MLIGRYLKLVHSFILMFFIHSNNLIQILWNFSHSVQSKNILYNLGRRVEYVVRLLPWLPWIYPLIEIFSRPNFKFIITAQPSVLNKIRYPYLDSNWRVLRRCTTIADHYRWLFNTLSPEQIQAIYSPQGLPVLDLQTPQRHYRAIFEYLHTCRREGDLMLTILSPAPSKWSFQSDLLSCSPR